MTYNNRNYNRILALSTGDEFEDSIIDGLKVYLRKNGLTEKLQIHSGDYLDKCQGTDFTIYGIRCDATSAFSKKDHVVKEFEPMFTKYGDLRFGIRTGNNHRGFTRFERPVVVIGMDVTPSYMRTWGDAINEAIAKMAPMIISYARECYNDYMSHDYMKNRKGGKRK